MMPLEEFPTSTAAPLRRERYSIDGRLVTSRAFGRVSQNAFASAASARLPASGLGKQKRIGRSAESSAARSSRPSSTGSPASVTGW